MGREREEEVIKENRGEGRDRESWMKFQKKETIKEY